MSWRERYTPYGEKLTDSPQNRDEPGFTSHVQDHATGLTYMQARYYDPMLGRFLSIDPIGHEDQLNLYAYVGNDPVNNLDPDGQEIVYTGSREFVEKAKGVVANVLSTGNRELIRRHQQLKKSPNWHVIREAREGEPTGARATGDSVDAENGVGTGSIVRLDMGMDVGDGGMEGVVTHELLGHSASIDLGQEDPGETHESGIPLDEAEAIDIENIYRNEIGLEPRPYEDWLGME